MSTHKPASLCMIVRNEESNLRLCLEPVAALFDEIIVVDTGSSDRTREVAAELGARVFDFAWCDDFAAARNETLKHATRDWIFWLDADDRLEPAHVQRLGELLAGLGNEQRAFMMTSLSLAQYPVDPAIVLPHCRLFRRHPQIRWTRRVHEQIIGSIEQLRHEIVTTDIQINHLGYKDPVLVRRKANRDLRLLRLEYATNPTDPVTLFHLGLVHLNMGQRNEALTYLLSALKHLTRVADWVRRLYALVGDTLSRLGRPEEALALLGEGLGWFPLDPGLLTRRASLLSQLGDPGGAERCLLQLLRSPAETGLLAGEQSILDRREARLQLGMLYQDQGRHLEAERVFQEVLAQQPDSVQAWVGLGYVNLSRQRFGEVEHVARQLDKCLCGPAYAATLRAEVTMAQNLFEVAYGHIDRAIALAPQMTWPRLVLANWLYRTGASLSARIAAHRDIVRMDPGHLAARVALENLERQERGEVQTSPLWFTITT